MGRSASTVSAPDSGWWRTVPLRDGESALGRLRGFELHLHRHGADWWVAHRRDSSGVPAENAASWRIGAEVEPPEPAGAAGFSRQLFDVCPEQVVVRPALADRAVMARPRVTVVIAPRQTVSVFVGTSLWVEVVAAGTKVLSEPIVRPSDTWLGIGPEAGELCYGVATSAPLFLGDLEVRVDRATTEAQIENRTDEPLVLESLRIPAPHLSLYSGGDGRLWTETIRLERHEVGEHALLEIVDGRPASAGPGAERVGEARQAPPARSAIRSFQRKAIALFGD